MRNEQILRWVALGRVCVVAEKVLWRHKLNTCQKTFEFAQNAHQF